MNYLFDDFFSLMHSFVQTCFYRRRGRFVVLVESSVERCPIEAPPFVGVPVRARLVKPYERIVPDGPRYGSPLFVLVILAESVTYVTDPTLRKHRCAEITMARAPVGPFVRAPVPYAMLVAHCV